MLLIVKFLSHHILGIILIEQIIQCIYGTRFGKRVVGCNREKRSVRTIRNNNK